MTCHLKPIIKMRNPLEKTHELKMSQIQDAQNFSNQNSSNHQNNQNKSPLFLRVLSVLMVVTAFSTQVSAELSIDAIPIRIKRSPLVVHENRSSPLGPMRVFKYIHYPEESTTINVSSFQPMTTTSERSLIPNSYFDGANKKTKKTTTPKFDKMVEIDEKELLEKSDNFDYYTNLKKKTTVRSPLFMPPGMSMRPPPPGHLTHQNPHQNPHTIPMPMAYTSDSSPRPEYFEGSYNRNRFARPPGGGIMRRRRPTSHHPHLKHPPNNYHHGNGPRNRKLPGAHPHPHNTGIPLPRPMSMLNRRLPRPSRRRPGNAQYSYPKNAANIQDIIQYFDNKENEIGPPNKSSASPMGDFSKELKDVQSSLLKDIREFAKRPSLLDNSNSNSPPKQNSMMIKSPGSLNDAKRDNKPLAAALHYDHDDDLYSEKPKPVRDLIKTRDNTEEEESDEEYLRKNKRPKMREDSREWERVKSQIRDSHGYLEPKETYVEDMKSHGDYYTRPKYKEFSNSDERFHSKEEFPYRSHSTNKYRPSLSLRDKQRPKFHSYEDRGRDRERERFERFRERERERDRERELQRLERLRDRESERDSKREEQRIRSRPMILKRPYEPFRPIIEEDDKPNYGGNSFGSYYAFPTSTASSVLKPESEDTIVEIHAGGGSESVMNKQKQNWHKLYMEYLLEQQRAAALAASARQLKKPSPMRMKIHIYPNEGGVERSDIVPIHPHLQGIHNLHGNGAHGNHGSHSEFGPTVLPPPPQLSRNYHHQQQNHQNRQHVNPHRQLEPYRHREEEEEYKSRGGDGGKKKNLVVHLHVHRRNGGGPSGMELEAEGSHIQTSTAKPNYKNHYEHRSGDPSAEDQRDKSISMELPVNNDKVQDVLQTLLKFRQ